MDFIDGLTEEIVARAAPKLAAAIVAEVVFQIKQEAVHAYSEVEAAKKLKIAPKALAKLRKDKQIEHTYSILPTLGADGKLHGGRIAYLPRHLDEHLLRNEQKHFFGMRAA